MVCIIRSLFLHFRISLLFVSVRSIYYPTMAWISMKPALLAILVALLSSDAQAWSTPLTKARAGFVGTALRMAEDNDLDKYQMTSARKQVVFDDKTGRFFETALAEVECIPDEEYCSLDESGKPIRLTVAEKERIFLDALQVSCDKV
jgi:hypothetical protein